LGPRGDVDAPNCLGGSVIKCRSERMFMRFVFLGLALVLFFTWIGAFVVFHVAAALVHVLLVLAFVFLTIHLISGRRPA